MLDQYRVHRRADDKGVSLILVNTEKGRILFEKIKADLNYIPAKLEDCLQPNLQHPSDINPNRMQFEKDYAKHGFEYVMTRYGNVGWRYKIRTFKNRMVAKIKSFLKKL